MSFTPTINHAPIYGSNFWSCCRNSANNAWNANGNNGYFNNNNLYNGNQAVPLSNYKQYSMIRLEDIIEAYRTARSNKRKSPDQADFEMHWEANCVRLYNEIVTHTARPTAYTFITDIPKPREVFASDMATRVLHHYLDIRLRPLLEARMTPHTFNNRVGMGQCACQNALISDIYEMSEGYTRDCWIVKVDLSGCFPNIVQDIAYKQIEQVILEDYEGEDKDELIYILQVCVFSYPTHHCYRKSPMWKWQLVGKGKSIFEKPDGIGAAIGHLIWQNAVNYYFHEIDEWLCSMPELRYERFVDDMAIVAHSRDVLLLLPELRKRLKALGATMNEKKFYCQHWSKGVEWLGVHIKRDRVYPNTRIMRRARQKARTQYNRVDVAHVESLLASVNSYLGICKNGNGYNQAKTIIENINKKWRKYVTFNTHRVCLQAHPQYSHRNIIISKYLHYDTTRNRRKVS